MNRERLQRELAWLYPWLRQFCRGLMSLERKNHTLQPTALTHEVLGKMLVWQGQMTDESRPSIQSLAATIARQTLIDSGRRYRRRKEYLEERESNLASSSPDNAQIERLRLALAELEAVDPNLRTLVELKYLHGLEVAEVASQLGWSERTTARRWSFAKSFLANAMHE